MDDDIRDILLVFLADSLPAIVRGQTASLPIGLIDLIRTATLESNGNLPFPNDVSELLYIFILTDYRL